MRCGRRVLTTARSPSELAAGGGSNGFGPFAAIDQHRETAVPVSEAIRSRRTPAREGGGGVRDGDRVHSSAADATSGIVVMRKAGRRPHLQMSHRGGASKPAHPLSRYELPCLTAVT